MHLWILYQLPLVHMIWVRLRQAYKVEAEGDAAFRKKDIAGFLGYPQLGGGTHPPIPREGVLGKVLGDWANLALGQAHKNTRSRVVRAAGA